MKTFTRIIAMLLVCVFLGAALVACGNKKNDNKEESKPTESNKPTQNGGVSEIITNEFGEESFTTAIQESLDFEEEELTVLVLDRVRNTREWYKESPEDELDEAIAMRNAAVEDELNVVIDYTYVPDYDIDATFAKLISEDVLDKYHYYDIVANYAYYGANTTIRDYLANFLDTETFPYFNFDLPCWNQAMVQNTTFNNRLYYIAGDLNISMFDNAMVIWHNKTLYDKKKEETDPVNMQDVALDGKWTYSELYRWSSVFYENANGKEGKQDDDNYGFCMYAKDGGASGDPCPTDAMPYAWDIQFVATNNDGTHSFTVADNEKAESALRMFQNLIAGDGVVYSYYADDAAQLFAAGHYVFWTDRIYWNQEVNTSIREMNDKYGLLPMPKYDAEQEQYGTTSQDCYNLMTLIDHSESPVPTKGKAVSAYLQLSTEESYAGVRGYYFNRIIKPKFFGTDDSEGTVTKSIALFDIIVDNIKFDFVTIYSYQLSNIAHLWRGAAFSTETLTQRYNAKKDAFEDAIKKTDEFLGLRTIDE